MDKNEILKKAQQEKEDEREVQVTDKALRWTYFAMVLLVGMFSFIRSQRGLSTMDLMATLCGSICVGHFYKYAKNKEKMNLIWGIVMFLCTIATTVKYIVGY